MVVFFKKTKKIKMLKRELKEALLALDAADRELARINSALAMRFTLYDDAGDVLDNGIVSGWRIKDNPLRIEAKATTMVDRTCSPGRVKTWLMDGQPVHDVEYGKVNLISGDWLESKLCLKIIPEQFLPETP